MSFLLLREVIKSHDTFQSVSPEGTNGVFFLCAPLLPTVEQVSR